MPVELFAISDAIFFIFSAVVFIKSVILFGVVFLCPETESKVIIEKTNITVRNIDLDANFIVFIDNEIAAIAKPKK